jgi:hypothetical protein
MHKRAMDAARSERTKASNPASAPVLALVRVHRRISLSIVERLVLRGGKIGKLRKVLPNSLGYRDVTAMFAAGNLAIEQNLPNWFVRIVERFDRNPAQLVSTAGLEKDSRSRREGSRKAEVFEGISKSLFSS